MSIPVNPISATGSVSVVNSPAITAAAGVGTTISNGTFSMASGSGNNGGIASIRLRDYQLDFLHQVKRGFEKTTDPSTPWNKEVPHDRGYLIAPWQTGKSKLGPHLAELAKDYFPEKKVLILSPYDVVSSQFVDDLLEGYDGVVSLFDADNKDLTGDVVVASAFSLAKIDALKKLNPDQFGLVIIDEMTFALAPSWQKILTRLGFVDNKGTIISSHNKFLLGMGATGERGDGRHVREVFGNRLLAGRGLNGMIEKGYLHDVAGIEVPYGNSEEDTEIIKDGEETVAVMRNTPENNRRVIDTYEKYLSDKKALIFVESIEHANALARDFNRIYDKQVAEAITAETSNQRTEEIRNAFNRGTGAKVLISIRKLALSFRALGVDGVLHAGQTNSWNLYAQRSGRPLARQEGEPQRTILIITMEGKAKPLDRAQSAATLMGVYDQLKNEHIYQPRRLSKTREYRAGVHHKVTRWGRAKGRPKLLIDEARAAVLRINAHRFGKYMQRILTHRFEGDVILMAEKAMLPTSTMDAYLFGILPPSFRSTMELALKLGVDYRKLTDAWVKDMMVLVEGQHPLSDKFGPAQKSLTRLMRLAIIHTAEGLSMISISGSVRKGDKGAISKYVLLKKGFNGNFPVQANSLFAYFDFIFVSGAADESDIRNVIGRYVAEMKEKGKIIGNPVDEFRETEFDHRHQDVLNMPNRVGLDEATEAEFLQFVDAPLSPMGSVISRDLAAITNRLLKTLSPRKENVLRQRFEQGLTLDEIGTKWDVSRERVLQIEIKALRRLRHPSRSKFLGPFKAPSLPEDFFFVSEGHPPQLVSEASRGYNARVAKIRGKGRRRG